MTDRTPSMTHATHAVVDNTNIQTPGPRGPALLRTSGSSRRMAHSADGKQAALFVPTSAPTAYGVIECPTVDAAHPLGRALCCPIKEPLRREP